MADAETLKPRRGRRSLRAARTATGERARLALQAGGLVTWEIDAESGAISGDDGLDKLFGLPEGAATGNMQAFIDRVHEEDRAGVLASFGAAATDGAMYRTEFRVRLDDGQIRWLVGVGQRHDGPDGRVRVIGYNADITDRKNADILNGILLAEFKHRMRNLFAIAAGIVRTTARAVGGPPAFADLVVGRFMALSKAHELIAPKVLSDQLRDDRPSLRSLVASILSPYRGEGEGRLRIDGPPVELGSNAAIYLALGLHEFATNAAKYGALSAEAGTVTISWKRAGDRVLMHWIERDGPGAAKGTSGSGFGTRLAEIVIENQLGGKVDYDWTAEGLRIAIDLPVANLDE